MKLLDVAGTAASNMMRSKVRTILTIIAIFIGAFTITLTLGLSAGVSSYIDKQVASIGAEDVLIVQPKVEIGPDSGPKKYDPEKRNNTSQGRLGSQTLSGKDVKIIEKQSGLSDVRPMLMVMPDYISGSNNEKYQLSIQEAIDSTRLDFAAGKLPDNSADRSEILITKEYVSILGYESDQQAVGRTVELGVSTPLGEQQTVNAVITGVQQTSILSQGGLTANNYLVDRLYEIQTKGLPAEASERYVAVVAKFDPDKGEAELNRIKKDLDLQDYRAVTVEDQIGIVKSVIDAITGVLVFFGAIALLAASFGIINTLYMSVQERTKEIGLMKAMGMSQFKVFLLFSIEAILIGFWGSLTGAMAAIVAGKLVSQIASDNFLKNLPGFELTAFPPLQVISVMLVIMFIAFLAGTLPSIRAAKQDPIKALRYE